MVLHGYMNSWLYEKFSNSIFRKFYKKGDTLRIENALWQKILFSIYKASRRQTCKTEIDKSRFSLSLIIFQEDIRLPMFWFQHGKVNELIRAFEPFDCKRKLLVGCFPNATEKPTFDSISFIINPFIMKHLIFKQISLLRLNENLSNLYIFEVHAQF